MATGFNTKEQADCILAALRAALAGLGVTTITRFRLRQPPEPPAAILIGPRINMGPLGIGMDEARYNWVVVLYRAIGDDERRADELDTWADAACTAIVDTACSCECFERAAGEGPDRLDPDDSLAVLLESLGRQVDPAIITFSTRRQIEVGP